MGGVAAAYFGQHAGEANQGSKATAVSISSNARALSHTDSESGRRSPRRVDEHCATIDRASRSLRRCANTRYLCFLSFKNIFDGRVLFGLVLTLALFEVLITGHNNQKYTNVWNGLLKGITPVTLPSYQTFQTSGKSRQVAPLTPLISWFKSKS